jgi:hypothetical protein
MAMRSRRPVSGFLRAFTEPSLIETLARPADERAAIADYVYGHVRERTVRGPEQFETVWRVARLRIEKIEVRAREDSNLRPTD